MKRRLRVAALLLVLGVAGLGTVAPTSAAASPAIVVSATANNSGDLAGGESLHVQVTVSNPTSISTGLLSATLLVDRSPFTSRDSLADWFAGKSVPSTTAKAVGSAPIASIASGLDGAALVSAAPSALPFGVRGVYGIYVRVDAGDSIIGTSRSAIVWNASSSAPVPVSIAVPLSVPPTEGEFLSAALLAQYTAPTGILTRELADIDNSQISIGIDPRVIASIRILGNSAPTSAQDWLRHLGQLPNETFPLQWADADLTAPLRAGDSSVLSPKSLDYAINPALFPAQSGSTPTPTPTTGGTTSTVPTSADLVRWGYTLPQLGWPAEDSAAPADLPKLASAGITATILNSSNVDGLGSRGLSGASGQSESSKILVSDDTLSAYLRSALESSSRSIATADLTEVSATLALISMESGKSPRTVLLTLNRNWATTDSDFVHEVSELYVSPWVTSAVLSSALADAPVSLKLDRDTESADHIALVSDMLAAERRAVRFAPVAAAPDAITSSVRLQLLSMLSDEWSDTPNAWTTAANQYVTTTNKIADSVQVTRSSTILGLADQLELPISISNGLDQDVTVTMLVRPTTPVVSIDHTDKLQTVTISADSQKRIQIPIHALSNGNAELVVTLSSSTGVPIGKAVTLKVNVQAGWETLGTLIFVALIVALFGVGIFTNFRRRRAAAAAEEAEG